MIKKIITKTTNYYYACTTSSTIILAYYIHIIYNDDVWVYSMCPPAYGTRSPACQSSGIAVSRSGGKGLATLR